MTSSQATSWSCWITEADARSTTIGATHLLYQTLHTMGVLGPDAPATLRQMRSVGPRSCEELIDRYDLACRPVRDLLVDYLRERQPSLDYASLDSLANMLGGLFWSDLERHHPGIDTLNLPAEVAQGWKQRLRTITTTRSAEGQRVETTAARINYRECLTPVRAFYLDLAHWAVEDPARWAAWAVPCPVGREEISRRKDKRHRKARMDARTRQRLPVLPTLVHIVNQRRIDAASLLAAATNTPPGETFTAAGQTLIRATTARSAATKIWAEDPNDGGTRRDLGREEEQAFWAFAAVEVLRATGMRIEELTELSHHSLVQYRLPTTGELVPLLQITPSKTDAERLLVVSPELADVLASIISRLRDPSGAIPLVAAYDAKERIWSPPKPLLFQRRMRYEHRAISTSSIRDMLADALAHAGLADEATGASLRFTPHDFRRLFITDAILNGLPPHIAQVIAGHQDINVTLGYKAIYPEEAIQAHLRSSPAAEPCGPARNTASQPMRNGASSSATSNDARSPSAPAAERSAHPASTSTPASAAPCCGPTPPNGPASPRSAPASWPASLKPNARAGSAKSRVSTSASPAPRPSSTKSTDAPPQPPPTHVHCPSSPDQAHHLPPRPPGATSSENICSSRPTASPASRGHTRRAALRARLAASAVTILCPCLRSARSLSSTSCSAR